MPSVGRVQKLASFLGVWNRVYMSLVFSWWGSPLAVQSALVTGVLSGRSQRCCSQGCPSRGSSAFHVGCLSHGSSLKSIGSATGPSSAVLESAVLGSRYATV